MLLSEFRIGLEFTTALGDKRWRCTDVGSRVVVAISLDIPDEYRAQWLRGPPFAVAEFVFDECDLPACEPA